MSPEAIGDDGPAFEQYRSYLSILARQYLNAAFPARIDESDLVQQTLLHAHRARNQYRGGSAVEYRAWLREILRNVLRDFVRAMGRSKRGPRYPLSLDQVLDNSSMRLERYLVANVTPPSKRVRRKELLLSAVTAMEELPERQRQAIELHYLQECPFSEVAARLQLNRNQVAGLIRRGIATLRQKMADSSY